MVYGPSFLMFCHKCASPRKTSNDFHNLCIKQCEHANQEHFCNLCSVNKNMQEK